MADILFKPDEFVFSYRVAGICIREGKVLLQKLSNEEGFAFPGGHVALGETNEETLVREFEEEIGARITVGDLKWVAEIFIPWGKRRCHQICLYYLVELQEDDLPREGSFLGKEQMEGRDFSMEFHWVPLEGMENRLVYPTNAVELLPKLDEGVQHFVYREV